MTELNDTEVIAAGVKSMADVSKNGLVPHFFYCGHHYFYTNDRTSRLQNMFLTIMRSSGIQSSNLTILHMLRRKLIVKETVEKAYKGKLEEYAVSINDDLESFFVNLQNQKTIKSERVLSFFTPKLTDEEMKLVEERNKLHLGTYAFYYAGQNPDFNDKKMKESDSKSKYVLGHCRRRTFPLTLESNEKETTENDLSDTKKKCILL